MKFFIIFSSSKLKLLSSRANFHQFFFSSNSLRCCCCYLTLHFPVTLITPQDCGTVEKGFNKLQPDNICFYRSPVRLGQGMVRKVSLGQDSIVCWLIYLLIYLLGQVTLGQVRQLLNRPHRVKGLLGQVRLGLVCYLDLYL